MTSEDNLPLMTQGHPKLILITGMSGLIGGLAGRDLATRHRVRALNRRDVPGFETVKADITDFDAIRPAFEGVHTVVHLSALLINVPDRDLLKVNIEGTYNVLEASRQAGVKRVVFASSGAVSGGYMREEPFKSLLDGTHADLPLVAAQFIPPRPGDIHGVSTLAVVPAQSGNTSRPWRIISHTDPARPTVFYGVTKIAGETMGRFFHETTGMSVICIRFGAVFPDDKPRSASNACVYMSHRDATQVVVKSVEAPESVGFEVFYALSDNASRFRDIDHARKVTGFIPQDGVARWPDA
ncbi:MAG: NAD(P)-dependent oxidoreductase [Dehalococcoidia bacterium]|nr:NAD(P)-dependent oxidoreductase [Dehalococcoidia bacterium]MSQ35041.1 NAD(P)-dependent oxidoreductase [Dehalococcoidia bacterium]